MDTKLALRSCSIGACVLLFSALGFSQQAEGGTEAEMNETRGEMDTMPAEGAEQPGEPGLHQHPTPQYDAEDYDGDEYGSNDFDAEYEGPADYDADPYVDPDVEPMTYAEPRSTMRESVFAAGAADDPYRPETVTPMGMSAMVGGGVTGFTEEEPRSFSEVGGGWDARLVIGTRTIIAGELAYLGSSRDVAALGLDESAFLQGHGGEAAARLNLLPGLFQPYLLAGAGFTRYTLTNEDFNTSSIDDSATVAHFPLGVGAALRYEGFVADARGVFRPTVEGDMFSDDSEMHTWGANLSLGAEF